MLADDAQDRIAALVGIMEPFVSAKPTLPETDLSLAPWPNEPPIPPIFAPSLPVSGQLGPTSPFLLSLLS